MTTDDPREVDWAEKHVRDLERQLLVLADRVKRLESQTEFETSEDDANILELRRAVFSDTVELHSRVTNAHQRITTEIGRINQLREQISGLRDAVIRRDERINSMDAVISSQGRAIGDLERRWVRVWEFMKQSGENSTMAQDVSPHVHWNIAPGAQMEPLGDAVIEGYEAGMNDAVSRLMAFLNNPPGQFPKAFVEEAIKAVRGS